MIFSDFQKVLVWIGKKIKHSCLAGRRKKLSTQVAKKLILLHLFAEKNFLIKPSPKCSDMMWSLDRQIFFRTSIY